ncbi:hypothetical protein [Latilactobacillus sakei]|uniref:Uncharacterized protein n=1 Tax=Latilactobacillus sakei TaxID=1599 RepID=A0AAF0GNP1_LATSK|nr:hypothetical protein [Latilactobacillus sakei]WGI18381.1 hypothetical protein QBD03_06365 [Latilactobacillus sakei]
MEKLDIENLNNIISALPTINANADFWMVRADRGQYYDDFNMSSYVGIGYDEISLKEAVNLTNEQLMVLFRERKPFDSNGKEIPTGTYTSWIGQLKRFANEITPGDYVLVPSESSERFALGVVIEQPYELTPEQLDTIEEVAGRQYSPFKKRIRVQFLRKFNRSSADPALYKMIYTQTTLSKINKYSSYILRASYDAYTSDNKVYLTFPVRQKEDIEAIPYTEFTYNLITSFNAIEPNQRPIIKNNVQSAGVVQLIVDAAPGAALFCLALVSLRSQSGFSIDFSFSKKKFSITKEDDRIVMQRVKNEETDRKIKEQNASDAHVERMIDIMNRLEVPMNEIQAEVSNELSNVLKEAAKPIDDSSDNSTD